MIIVGLMMLVAIAMILISVMAMTALIRRRTTGPLNVRMQCHNQWSRKHCASAGTLPTENFFWALKL